MTLSYPSFLAFSQMNLPFLILFFFLFYVSILILHLILNSYLQFLLSVGIGQ